MATKVSMAVEEYLRTSWPDGDREYVHGEILEKPRPPKAHAKIQKRLLLLFSEYEAATGLCALPELRCAVAPGVFRLPDVAVFNGEPEGETPTTPADAVIEILSPDDRMALLLGKLREYRDWGVRHVWLVDPGSRRLYEFASDGLKDIEALELPEHGIRIGAAEVFPEA